MSRAFRIDSFRGSLVFAAGAALGWPAWVAVLSALGFGPALAGYLIVLSAVYVASLASSPARAAGAALLALTFGATTAFLARGPADVAIGCALAIGVARSGLLQRRRAARALVLELLLLGGGLFVARSLVSPGLFGIGLALWGFFLVQSLAPLVAGARPAGDTPEGVDPFDFAHGRALAILDD